MPCDTRPRRRGQTLTERKIEVRAAIDKLSKSLVAGSVKPVIGPQGAIAFKGWTEDDRGAVSDACAYRLLMVSGGALAKAAIARAEQIAGRSVDKRVIGQGVHSHDGGHTWGSH